MDVGTIFSMALSHVGDDANVDSPDPPYESIQVEKCAQFYPTCRDVILRSYPWTFIRARKDEGGGEKTSEASSWQYAYALPNMCLKVYAVLPPGAPDDVSALAYQQTVFGTPTDALNYGTYQPQDFTVESLEDGSVVVYTNQEDAIILYTKRVTDTTKYPEDFALALSLLLGSCVAGPLIRGKEGRATAKDLLQTYRIQRKEAVESDASQEKMRVRQNVPWLTDR